MKTFIALIGILCNAIAQSSAYAEGGCPQGMVPFQFAPNQPPSCAPMPSGSQRQSQEIWADRYGAIVVDWSHDILSAVIDMRSEEAAQTAALDDCKARGGNRCAMKQSFRNGCAAVTFGDPDGVNFATAATAERAKAIGIEGCIKAGDMNCRTYYSACSFPVRIQ